MFLIICGPLLALLQLPGPIPSLSRPQLFSTQMNFRDNPLWVTSQWRSRKCCKHLLGTRSMPGRLLPSHLNSMNKMASSTTNKNHLSPLRRVEPGEFHSCWRATQTGTGSNQIWFGCVTLRKLQGIQWKFTSSNQSKFGESFCYRTATWGGFVLSVLNHMQIWTLSAVTTDFVPNVAHSPLPFRCHSFYWNWAGSVGAPAHGYT